MSRKYKVKRYKSIYGPNRKQSFIKGALAALSIMVLFGAAWLLYEPMVNFIEEFKNPSPLPPVSSSQSAAESQPQGDKTDPAQPAAKPVTSTLDNLVYMPTNVLLDKTLFDKSIQGLKDSGIHGIVFDLKDAQGILLYKSALTDVQTAKAQSPQAFDLKEIASRISDAGFTPVGRIFTFKDKTSPKALLKAAVKYIGTDFNWVDNAVENGGKPWLNPYSAAAQDYNISIINECMDLGVKSIILDGVQFPTGFSLEKAAYGEESKTVPRSKVLVDFANKAKAAVASKNKDGRCWLMLPASALALKDTAPLGAYGGDIASVAAYSDLMVDFMISPLGKNDLLAKTLSVESLTANPSQTVAALAGAIGSITGKVTPIIETSASAPAKADIDKQLKALKSKNFVNGYVVWSISGSYNIAG